MITSALVRVLRGVALGAVVACQWGCTGADNPKLAEAPEWKPPPVETEPPKVGKQKNTYGEHPQYLRMQERMEQHYQ